MQFDKMHPATSVVNRILNLRDDFRRAKPVQAQPASQPAPAIPDPTAEGLALDAALTTPAMGAQGPAGDAIVQGAIEGVDPLESLAGMP